MSRTAPAEYTTACSGRFGLEPIPVVIVNWATPVTYSTKEYTSGVIPRLTGVSEISDSIDASGHNQIASSTVTIVDPDRAFADQAEADGVEGRWCTIQSRLDGVTAAVLTVMLGQIQGPVEWDEGDRTVSFDVVSHLPEFDIGWAPTVTQLAAAGFDNYDVDVAGQPWPFAFGAPIHSPTLRITKQLTTMTTGDIVITYDGVASSTTLTVALRADGTSPFNALTPSYLEIDGHVIGVTYVDTTTAGMNFAINATFNLGLNVKKATLLNIALRDTGDPDYNDPHVIWLAATGLNLVNNYAVIGGDNRQINYCRQQQGTKCWFADPWRDKDTGAAELLDGVGVHEKIIEVSTFPDPDNYLIYKRRLQSEEITIPAGSTVRYWSATGLLSEAYVANYTHGDTVVRQVCAYRTDPKSKIRVLTPLPWSATAALGYFTIGTATAGAITSTAILLKVPLSEYIGEGWEEELYVTLQAEVEGGTTWNASFGNPAGIIDAACTRAGVTIDLTSFAAVASALDDFPMSFTLTDIKKLREFIGEIAWQARCVLYYNGVSVKIKFLAQAQVAETVTTLSLATIEGRSLKTTYTETVDLVTHVKVSWKPNGAVPVRTYNRWWETGNGYHHEDWDFYAYNNLTTLSYAVDFWLTRKAWMWRQFEMDCTMPAVAYEVFDVIPIDIDGYVPDACVQADVQYVSIDLMSNKVKVKVQIPVLVGSDAVDTAYWGY